MSLEAQLKEWKEELKEAEKAEAVEPVEEAVVEPVVEEPEEKPVEEAEKPADEPKPEEKPAEIVEDKEEKGAARLRREAKAAEERAKKAEERAQELEEKLKAKAEPEEKPEVELPPVVIEMLDDHNKNKAWNELTNFEAEARRSNPDYDAVAAAYTASLAQSFRTLNPDAPAAQIVEMTKQKILEQASGLLNKGHANPAEEMYHRAKEMGFKARVETPEKPEKEAQKPDMAQLAANRARSAGTSAAPGKSEPQLTPAAVGEMTSAEYMKLTPDQKNSVMAQLRARA